MGTAKRMDPEPVLRSASALTGNAVVNVGGEKLGTLEDIMMDLGSGQVHFAILVREDDRLVAVPWDALALDPRDQRLVMDIDKAKFDKAPSFDRNSRPEMGREWEVKVEGFFGRKPFWDMVEERWIGGP